MFIILGVEKKKFRMMVCVIHSWRQSGAVSIDCTEGRCWQDMMVSASVSRGS